MKSYKKERESKFLKIFLWLTIILGLLDVLSLFKGLWTYLLGSAWYSSLGVLIILIQVLSLIFLLVGVYALIYFWVKKFNKLTLVVPFILTLSLIVGIVVGIVRSLYGVSLEPFVFFIDLTLILITIIFAIYLLRKFK